MAVTGTVDFLGRVTGLASGDLTFRPARAVLAAAVGTRQLVNCPNAATQTIPIPTGASYVGITPPSGAVQALLLRTAGGNGTGVALPATNPSLVALSTGAVNVLLENPGGVAVNGVEVCFL